MYVISGLPSAPLRTVPFPILLGRTSPDGLPTASRVAAGTESAATTCGDSAVVPVSAVPVPDDPVASMCEDAEAGGFDVPAALTTTMAAMAATTSPTGTSAVMTGWRERNRVGAVASPGLALASDDTLDLEPGRTLDVDGLFLLFLLFLLFVLFVLVVGRAGRDDPEGDFDMMFS